MSFKKNDKRYDFEVCCPYNKKHQMPFSKLWFHISKGCKDKRDKGHRYEVCPYNCLHIIVKAKFEDHKMKCRYKTADAEHAQEDDLFKEMQMVAGQQFGGGGSNNNQQSLCQSNISSIPQNKSLPNWRDIWDSQSEVDDVEELNSISSLNEKYFEEEFQTKQQLSSGISKSFQSSGIKEQDGDDDYYY